MDIHANIECPQCKKIFDAKLNMKRHVKNVHETHQGLNESDVEDNFNADPLHYGKVSMGGATFRILNFASHFIRVQIFQINFSVILYL